MKVPKIFTLFCLLALSVYANLEAKDSQTQESAFKLTSKGGVLDVIEGLRVQMVEQVGLGKLYDQMSDAMSMLTQSGHFQTTLRRTHTDRGAFRSGMGAPEQLQGLERTFLERERMEDLEASKEIVTDISLAEKQFKYFNQQFKSRIGAQPNNELDLSPVDLVIDRTSLLNSSSLVRAEGVSKYGRALAGQNKEPTVQISRLEEPYPTSCQNHGQLST